MDREDLMTTVPMGEECAQVGSSDYSKRAAIEADAFIKQLKSEIGRPPARSYFESVYHDHDLGSYITLAYYYDYDNNAHLRYLEKLQEEMPEYWSEEAEAFLRENGYYDE